MRQRILKIATRKSPLALWQAEFVKSELEKYHPSLQVELLPMVTDGDVLLDSPLSKIGGKGLFVKQLEVAILEGKADLAVHSIKDIPAQFPEGLMLSTICPRDEIRDAFISNQYDSLACLPKGAIVGTSSLRRQAQIQQHFPDLIVKSLRGNVGTRLSKLDSGEYDGIILAAVGLKRLGLESRIKQCIDTDIMIPAVGQGAVGIETREEDRELHKLLAPLDDVNTRIQVLAERAMNRILNGGCQVPIACLSEIVDSNLKLKGWVGSLSSTQSVTVELSGSINEPTLLGEEVGKKLLSLGADKILKAILA